MSTLTRNGLILLAVLVCSILAITPPEQKLRGGKDLAGGASLLYGVAIKPTDPPETLSKVQENLHKRLDPNGVMEISIVPQGADRLEITMPLPSESVKKLKQQFEDALSKVATSSITRERLEQIASLAEDQQAAAIQSVVGPETDAARIEKITKAVALQRQAVDARNQFTKVNASVRALTDQIVAAGGEQTNNPVIEGLKTARKPLQDQALELGRKTAQAELAAEPAFDDALKIGLNPGELRQAVGLSKKAVRKPRNDGTIAELGAPRDRAIAALKTKYPQEAGSIDKVVSAWNAYEKQRRSLDDPQDIITTLKGAGVLNFRIAVVPGEFPGEGDARAQLKAKGPRSARIEEAHWYKVNDIDSWVRKAEDIESLESSAPLFFRGHGLVGEEYKGEYYALLWDRPGQRLTENDGQWGLSHAAPSADQYGKPAIAFEMDIQGADKLGRLTENNINKPMAVLLDDQIYTAPNLQSRISDRGQITGSFEPSKIDYVVRVLSAGSLAAKLSPEPISQSSLGPSLGKENLDKGLVAGIVAFCVVAVFMTAYYFFCGAISMVALVLNVLMIVAAMALNKAAFTLPGIAGLILTFGMAVDANVLIYERMREEFRKGEDLRTAVRLGYEKALAAIVDGNITTLIAAVVLAFTGTQEIRGFALTLGIGTVTTLFAQLFGTRVIFDFLVEKFHWRKVNMLPMAMGWTLHPNIDWLKLRFFSYAISLAVMFVGLGFLIYEGTNLLGTEFRGGTAVTLRFKKENGKQLTLSRSQVEDRVHDIGKGLADSNPKKEFSTAEIIAVNPEADGKHSGTFTIKTLLTDPNVVQDELVKAFANELDVRQSLAFTGSSAAQSFQQPIFPISSPILGEVIDKPGVKHSVGEYEGGVAILLDKITPPLSKAELITRLDETRNKPDNASIAARPHDLVVLEGTDASVTSAVVLVRDPDVRYGGDSQAWTSEVSTREWKLVQSALTQNQTLAEVQSFSPAVASTFKARAIGAAALATLLIVMYIWVRFNSFRYSLAAIVTTLHDCVVALSFVGVASVIYRTMPGVAAALGILPFKIDLNVVAAVLTILGYSLNDTVIVMDRIRENRGKLPYATRHIINDAINSTMSRTVITASTTFMACVVIYVMGGEGVRVFAYTMLIGIVVGTYSSIAVAAPLIWNKAADPTSDEEPVTTGARTQMI